MPCRIHADLGGKHFSEPTAIKGSSHQHPHENIPSAPAWTPSLHGSDLSPWDREMTDEILISHPQPLHTTLLLSLKATDTGSRASDTPLNTLVQFSSVAQSCPTLCNPMECSTPGFPVHHHLLELLNLMSIESVMPSNHLILCCPLILPPSIFPSIRVFQTCQFFTSGGQSIGASVSASVLPMKSQD